ncbi:hypothetical protein G4Y79_10580 [Phototrophicus methaneseepsis]|uniref:Uncharacterized protein n=1 Tax=Phototrophicus methaneseepsis TaxID=2710758 RepID=A0A7S8IH17_9CHLR|nr:hypothetical protein [Phototrophicus methaneseepsis]QPC84793.1 hypothetical protein G4Y79_10580 [Phototrophicus methaneseepsis]
MSTNRSEHWGCLYLVKTGDQYWLRTLCVADHPSPERVTQLPEASDLIHVVYTDNVPYIKEKLGKRFAWEAIDARHFKLSEVDITYVRSVSSLPPLKVLRALLPNVSYALLFATYQRLQSMLGANQQAIAS